MKAPDERQPIHPLELHTQYPNPRSLSFFLVKNRRNFFSSKEKAGDRFYEARFFFCFIGIQNYLILCYFFHVSISK